MRSDARFSFLSQTNVDGGPNAALLPNLTQRAEIETARSNRREAQIIRRVAFWYAIPTRRRQENRKNAENFKKKRATRRSFQDAPPVETPTCRFKNAKAPSTPFPATLYDYFIRFQNFETAETSVSARNVRESVRATAIVSPSTQTVRNASAAARAAVSFG